MKHELVSKLKELAVELGRTPYRDEFLKLTGLTRHNLEVAIGGWTPLVKASGLGKEEKVNRKLQIKQHLERIVERELKEPIKKTTRNLWTPELKDNYRIVVTGDLHSPCISEEALTGLYSLVEQYQPTMIASCGDAFDMFSQSRFAKTLNWMTPKAEYEAAREQLGKMWETLKKISPNSRLLQISGNHSARPMRRVLDVAPDLEHFIDMDKIIGFEGVETIVDPRAIVMLAPDVELTHGDHTSRALNYALERNHNIVHGHDHKGTCSRVTTSSGKQLWVASAGHMADLNTVPMQYTMKEKPNWQRGVTLIDPLGPRFISL